MLPQRATYATPQLPATSPPVKDVDSQPPLAAGPSLASNPPLHLSIDFLLLASPAVSATRRASVHEAYEVHDPSTQRYFAPQRQQYQTLPPQATLHKRPSTSSGTSFHTLRRTPRFGDDTDLLRRGRDAAPTPAEQAQQLRQFQQLHQLPAKAEETEPQPQTRGRPRRRLTQDLGSSSHAPDASTVTAADPSGLEESYWPKRSSRVSRRTAQAILFALEEAIRAPYPFTPDRTEEEARLSQLLMAGIPEGYGDPLPGGRPPPQRDPAEPRTITPPTRIMQLRKEREERREREKERERELLKQQQQQQQSEEQERKKRQEDQEELANQQKQGEQEKKEQRTDTGGVAVQPGRAPLAPLSNVSTANTRRNNTDVYGSPGLQRQRNEGNNQPSRTRAQSQTLPSQLPGPTGGSNRAAPPIATAPIATTNAAQQNPKQEQRSSQPEQTRARARTTTSNFPHAFERWETLSSHWEGLTGYWIKKLDANKEELNRQPLNQQLARQVTDLSAAGANLFHAVVELQRLRASSERKFQRWFFETRKESEQANEKIASLQRELKEARANAGAAQAAQAAPAATRSIQPEPVSQEQIRAIQAAAQQAATEEVERIKLGSKKQLDEMRRELQISRDEARRGWEEIGRMEQSERDRMFSLKRGEPTLVGGVQVVPMLARGGPSSSNRPSTREGGLSSHPVQPEDMQQPGAGYDQGRYNYDRAHSEADTDPFTRDASSAHGTVPMSQPPTTFPTSAAAVAANTRAKSASPALRPPTSTGPSPRPSATTGAPSTTAIHPPHAPTAPSAPSTVSTAFYQQPVSVLHQPPGASHPTILQAEDTRSYGTVSEDDYAGNPPRDAHGNPIIYQSRHGARSPSEASEDYGQPLTAGTGYAGYQAAQAAQRAAAAAATSNGNGHSAPAPAPDYEGAGYGNTSEWGFSRHHHPTRLSDVQEEEDERSRTSPSRASSRSRGFR